MDFFERRANQVFKWGEHDCCLLAADFNRELLGIDFAESFRGYSSEKGAYFALIRETGTHELDKAIDILAERHGFREVDGPPQTGDVAIARIHGHKLKYLRQDQSLAVFYMDHWLTAGLRGVIKVHDISSKIWRPNTCQQRSQLS